MKLSRTLKAAERRPIDLSDPYATVVSLWPEPQRKAYPPGSQRSLTPLTLSSIPLRPVEDELLAFVRRKRTSIARWQATRRAFLTFVMSALVAATLVWAPSSQSGRQSRLDWNRQDEDAAVDRVARPTRNAGALADSKGAISTAVLPQPAALSMASPIAELGTTANIPTRSLNMVGGFIENSRFFAELKPVRLVMVELPLARITRDLREAPSPIPAYVRQAPVPAPATTSVEHPGFTSANDSRNTDETTAAPPGIAWPEENALAELRSNEPTVAIVSPVADVSQRMAGLPQAYGMAVAPTLVSAQDDAESPSSSRAEMSADPAATSTPQAQGMPEPREVAVTMLAPSASAGSAQPLSAAPIGAAACVPELPSVPDRDKATPMQEKILSTMSQSTTHSLIEAAHAAFSAPTQSDVANGPGAELGAQSEALDEATSEPSQAAAESAGGSQDPVVTAAWTQAADTHHLLAAIAGRDEVQSKQQETAAVRLEAEFRRHLLRAQTFLKQGNILAARLVIERMIEIRPGEALSMLAQTYDPRMLVEWKTIGIRGDRAMADELYARAQAAGGSQSKISP